MRELIIRESLMKTIENVTVTNAQLEKENDFLRRIVSKSDADCIYCGLQKKDMVKCAHGFPGCRRADDLLMEKNNG